MQEERFALVLQSVEIIEKEIEKKTTPKNIKRIVIENMNYNDRHFDRIFFDILGCSMDVYIKDACYFHAFQQWCREKKPLAQRDTYEGIPYFPLYFKRRFGCSIYEAEKEERMKEKLNISKKELEMLKETLDNSMYISSYDIKGGSVGLHVDMDMMLLTTLAHEVYAIPEVIIRLINWKEMDEDEKKMMLIIFNKYEKGQNNIIKTTAGEMATEYEMLSLYDLDNPAIINGIYLFGVKLDNIYKPYFTKSINSILSKMEIKIPNGPGIPTQYINVIETIKNCREFVTISRIAEKSKKTENEIIDILWDMAQKGFLRVNRGC